MSGEVQLRTDQRRPHSSEQLSASFEAKVATLLEKKLITYFRFKFVASCVGGGPAVSKNLII